MNYVKFDQEARIETMLTSKGGSLITHNELKAVMYVVTVAGTETPYMAIWKGKQTKPFLHYRFRTLESLYQNWEANKNLSDRIAADKSKMAATRQAEKEAAQKNIKVGDIFYTSWGYEQTNIDFYEVVSKKGAKVQLMELLQERNCSDYDRGSTMPLPGQYKTGEVISKIATRYIKIDEVRTAWAWDGRPKSWSSYA